MAADGAAAARPVVAIFGAGIAGLSAAHELAELDAYEIHVYELDDAAGGMARSARWPEDDGVPSEVSYRGFGPQYHSAFDVMGRIPSARILGGSVFDHLSRPIRFAMPPDALPAGTDPAAAADDIFLLRGRLRLTALDRLRVAWALARCWCASPRRAAAYAAEHAETHLRARLSPEGARVVASTFGPWIGVDRARASRFHVGAFFETNRHPGAPAPHRHAADARGPAWTHGARDGWLVLDAPSNEAWFDPWVAHLEARGVAFHFRHRLDALEAAADVRGDDGDSRPRVVGAWVLDLAAGASRRVAADRYVLAVNPFVAARVVAGSGGAVRADRELAKFAPLTADGPHLQVSFRLAFAERVRLPPRCMVILPDSPWDVTFFPQDATWPEGVDLGPGVGSLWSGTACVADRPGALTGKPLAACTRAEFVAEVEHQVRRCAGLDALVRAHNGGRGLEAFPLARPVEVWRAWRFADETEDGRVAMDPPKWVMSTTTEPHLPATRTGFANLALAGAHTATSWTVWSMESAAESGRRAAHALDPRARPVIPRRVPPLLRALRWLDALCVAARLPNVVDVLALATAAAALGALALGAAQ